MLATSDSTKVQEVPQLMEDNSTAGFNDWYNSDAVMFQGKYLVYALLDYEEEVILIGYTTELKKRLKGLCKYRDWFRGSVHRVEVLDQVATEEEAKERSANYNLQYQPRYCFSLEPERKYLNFLS